MAIITAESFVSVVKKFSLVGRMIEGYRFIKNTDILVGIPEDKNVAHSGGITNAELLFIHQNGSPARNIPARPVLTKPLDDAENVERLHGLYKNAIKLAMLGEVDSAKNIYEKIGMKAQVMVQKEFGKIGPPLKPATIKAKGSSATLIDTGALRQAITYVVRDKKK